jgi:hypothetical protein
VFIFAAFLAYQGAQREGFYAGTFDAFCDALADLTPVRAADEPAQPAGEPGPSYPEDSAAHDLVVLSVITRIPFDVLAGYDDELLATYAHVLETYPQLVNPFVKGA